ncbi:hypothetical protein LTR70_008444 [Exophiala xenobiotica]|uniref:Non-structural maintenance of chromosomes element 4 n=1 Tax=Lithohypha guttulata TaxID=1690604 RepID=A0ABR0K2L5_9EURO|nr:hypothetical protein LTR24_008078 [Lithohypha guttulata]KAK5312011.1 hypothetical protein LTR70_008444 [Exophiala xenobiotica]
MARINNRHSSVDQSFAASRSQRQQRAASEASNPSSEVSGSDKENPPGRSARSSLGKRKSTSGTMSTPQPPSNTAGNKRRRLEDKGKAPASQSGRRRNTSERVDESFYDPDQDEAVKSETTKRLRELTSLVNDSRAEYMQRGSRGIQNTIKEADEIIKNVKQTSTATIESRLLVSVGDLAYKKISTMTLGDSSTGIDVDDFLSKCISYMRTTPTTGSTQPPSTQRRRQRRPAHNDSDNDEEDEDVTDLNWAHLGRTLCFPASNRPCLSSFLLGPLSVQKKQRQQTQRRATQRTNLDPATAARPVELDQEALDKQESASLTQICSEIAALLRRAQDQGEKGVERDVDKLREEALDDDYDPPEHEVRALMRKHNIADNGNVPLFHFCVNPRSFGQTVENFFYVSFLVKEGRVGLEFDSEGMPTLGMVQQKSVEERQESVRNQAVFTLDFDIWEELVDSCGIEKSVIPHRRQEEWETDDGVIRGETVLPERRREEGVSSGAAAEEVDVDVIEDDELYS